MKSKHSLLKSVQDAIQNVKMSKKILKYRGGQGWDSVKSRPIQITEDLLKVIRKLSKHHITNGFDCEPDSNNDCELCMIALLWDKKLVEAILKEEKRWKE